MAKTDEQIIADLTTRRDAVLNQLAEMAAGSVGALPNTSGTGDHIDHVGLRKSLYEELKEIEGLLERIQGPTDSFSRGRLV